MVLHIVPATILNARTALGQFGFRKPEMPTGVTVLWLLKKNGADAFAGVHDRGQRAQFLARGGKAWPYPTGGLARPAAPRSANWEKSSSIVQHATLC